LEIDFVLIVFFLLVVANGLKTAAGTRIAVVKAFVEGAEGSQLLGHDLYGL